MNIAKDRPVGVLMGGCSSERDVSLRSGQAVARGLESLGYQVLPLDIRSERPEWPDDLQAVFIALHGAYGEDGGIQGCLRKRGIPFAGAGEAASRIAFDKVLSKQRFVEYGVPTPCYEILRDADHRTLPLPVVVKPPRQGSSIGVHVVMQEADWPKAFADARRYDERVLVERYVPGRELTVGLVGDEVLPPLEIRPRAGFYDFEAKYTRGASEYLVPAPLSPEATRACRAIARKAFDAVGCRHLGRVDFRLSPVGEPLALEINTIPGFTETSLLPKAAAAVGLAFPALCERILLLADTEPDTTAPMGLAVKRDSRVC